MTKVLVIGSGGREHALAWRLAKSEGVEKVWVAPGNAGTGADSRLENLPITDIEALRDWALENKIDLTVVGPEAPLSKGVVNVFRAAGLLIFGPTKEAAQLESSKDFAKAFMKRKGIPTAEYESFTDPQAAHEYVRAKGAPIVIKADGLALGKGVIVAQTVEEAKTAVRSMIEDKAFGQSGARVVIEEFMEGPEVSVLSFTDGETVVPMVSSMDHKCALDGDKGPNTGGMGTIAPNPCYTEKIADECMQTIFLPTIRAMKAEGRPFKGCLYFGLMLTKDGPKVVEYNCRFGDPETQVVLPLLKSDLLTVMQATTSGTLKDVPVEFSTDSACCVVLASNGYPKKYESGFPITMSEEAAAHTYVAGAKKDGDRLLTAGGRVLGVTAVAPTLEKAVKEAYRLSSEVDFANKYCRSDIGRKALAAQKERE